ncbi:MAG: hypothetical protein JWP34_4788 [Massilia sp.]|nr:hypothetical protein [Massilia sp.]
MKQLKMEGTTEREASGMATDTSETVIDRDVGDGVQSESKRTR